MQRNKLEKRRIKWYNLDVEYILSCLSVSKISGSGKYQYPNKTSYSLKNLTLNGTDNKVRVYFYNKKQKKECSIMLKLYKE